MEVLRELSGPVEQSERLGSHRVINISVHSTVQVINSINGGSEVDEEFSDFFQAFLFLDIPTLGEGLQEVRLIRSGKESCLEEPRQRPVSAQLGAVPEL